MALPTHSRHRSSALMCDISFRTKRKPGWLARFLNSDELRCGHITTRRELAIRFSGQFDRSYYNLPRASLKSSESETGMTCALPSASSMPIRGSSETFLISCKQLMYMVLMEASSRVVIETDRLRQGARETIFPTLGTAHDSVTTRGGLPWP
jgi:hypothetical protein